ncbi:septation protein SepH [Microbispora triticiradicis]|uniref:DUF3071 domain-containing protein n=2 Tax=Microbispora TaxID=2005 RepID=A0ABY3M690_9ACTN|nr:DUF3071 domain-containing protein [Microbispora fusca]TYB68207.1 DUF3071 domain-containing protein [Microbispora tritici]
MQELRVVAVSRSRDCLVLAVIGQEGRYVLPVSDRLRAALDGSPACRTRHEIQVDKSLSPKEIQARMRAGHSAEEIAALAGIPVERVRRYEGPVLHERDYMVVQAQRSAVLLHPKGESRQTLADLVNECLLRYGLTAGAVEWDAAKRDDGLWLVKIRFLWMGNVQVVEWLYDPRRQQTVPAEEGALKFCSGPAGAPPTGTHDLSIASAPADDFPSVEPEAGQVVEGASGPTDEPDRWVGPAPGSTNDAVRAGSLHLEDLPDSRSEVETPSVERLVGRADATSKPENVAPAKGALAKKRRQRASVPSWDEIMFGPARDR